MSGKRRVNKRGVLEPKKARRYSAEDKKEVVTFVHKWDAEHGGRGGLTAAAKKWGMSQVTVRAWLRDPAIQSAVLNTSPPAGWPPPIPSSHQASEQGDLLRRLAVLADERASLFQQLVEKEREWQSLRDEVVG